MRWLTVTPVLVLVLTQTQTIKISNQMQGQPCVQLRTPCGASATVALLGAQLLSWIPAAGGERLYLSPRAVFDGRSAIRGGIPVCFPQFNARGPLPKHGFARNRAWQVLDPGSETHVTLRLCDDDASRALWTAAFDLRLHIVLGTNHLRITLEVRNTGNSPWSFTGALHTYLRVNDLARIQLSGLQQLPVWDAVRDQRGTESAAPLVFNQECDRVYTAAGHTVTMQAVKPVATSSPIVGLTKNDGLRISQSASFANTVVWNPGAVLCATLADLPADGFRHMLCVEAACVDIPVLVAPGTIWKGWQELTVLTAPAIL